MRNSYSIDRTPYGYNLEVVHDESGEVVNSWFVRDNPPKSGPLTHPAGFSIRTTKLFSGVELDTKRLDWIINHPDAHFDVDEQRLKLSCYVVANPTSGDEHACGVSGRFMAWGETHRDCIDAFLRGKAKRID